MAEQELAGSGFPVRVMPMPSGIRGGCGVCLRFSPEGFEGASEFLLQRGFADAQAYWREEIDGAAYYKSAKSEQGGENAT